MVTSSGRGMAALALLGRRAFRSAVVRRVALQVAAARGHALALVFHRISGERSSQALIPTVPETLFRRQVEALRAAGEIVPLEALLGPPPDRHRPRFALTFDDDWTSHYERVLPILQHLGVTATFFLSGRSLHRLRPLWFERLDALIVAQGTGAVARRLGVETDDPARLALACENDFLLQERIDDLPDGEIHHLSGVQIRALADAGMAIGFHTLRHPLLSLVPDAALDAALADGRAELERAAGRPVRLFAYPHGKPDRRVVERLPSAGFVAACTGRPVPIRPGNDPYLLGRWESGPIALDRFAAGIAARLNGWSATRE
jgi:peptidoglycan/xylan/chitin deacetylase (PgdA/CDA1 family)